MPSRTRLGIFIEILVVSGIAATALVLFRSHSAIRMGEFRTWIIPAVFLYAPLAAMILIDRDAGSVGLSFPRWGRVLKDTVVFLLAVLPVFLLGWCAFAHFYLGQNLAPRVPADILGLGLWQLIGVALPEEVFFRGWLQGRFNLLMKPRWGILGAQIGPGLFLAAALFAGAHYLVNPHPVRLLVFFPGLLFGLYRERSGSVLVPILTHAPANLLFLAVQGWAS